MKFKKFFVYETNYNSFKISFNENKLFPEVYFTDEKGLEELKEKSKRILIWTRKDLPNLLLKQII